MIEKLFAILSKHRFSLEKEKETQLEIAALLKNKDIDFTREFILDKESTIDFMFEEQGIGMEVKIKGGKRAIYRQCERYCSFDKIKTLILVTGRSMGMPKEINNKPIYLINLSAAWL
jgi:hypothetical protein